MNVNFKKIIFPIVVLLAVACGPNEEEQYRQKLLLEIESYTSQATQTIAAIEKLPPVSSGLTSTIPTGMQTYDSFSLTAGRWRGNTANAIVVSTLNGKLLPLADALSERNVSDWLISAGATSLAKPLNAQSSQVDILDKHDDLNALATLQYAVLVDVSATIRPQVISEKEYTKGSISSQVSVYDIKAGKWVASFQFNISSNDEMKYNFGGYNQDYKGTDTVKMQRQVMADLAIKFESELVKVLQK
ncbi:hypothetical protein K1X76_06205 [bacterium]|nr:hypothetical protein [bacterium]